MFRSAGVLASLLLTAVAWVACSSGDDDRMATAPSFSEVGPYSSPSPSPSPSPSLSPSLLPASPSPSPNCTFTKGWYRNKNGSPTVIAVDGRTVLEAQTIFKATPGDPLGVTWTDQGAPPPFGNANLNLYQQLLAALQNLGGDPLGGPPAVDAAIAAALAGTGGTGLDITVSLTSAERSALIDVLSDFNEGQFAGFPHCPS